MQSPSLSVCGDPTDWLKTRCESKREFFLLIVLCQSSNRPSFHFSKIPLQSRRSIWSVLLISVPAASRVKKNISSLVSLIGKCYSVGAALTSITSMTLCHWRFADRKFPAGARKFSKAGCCFDHSHSKMPKCVCDWNIYFFCGILLMASLKGRTSYLMKMFYRNLF